MTDLPAGAVTAAAEALKARHAEIAGEVIPYDEPELLADITAVLEAAAPHITAAERDATVEAMYAGAAKAVENAVAAERERCAQLAALTEEVLATFHESGDGQRARVGQVQVARWRARLEEAMHG